LLLIYGTTLIQTSSEEDRATATGIMHRKFREVWTWRFWDMRAEKQADKTDNQIQLRRSHYFAPLARVGAKCWLWAAFSAPLVDVNIHKVKWRHSNLWSQYDLYVEGQHGVLTLRMTAALGRFSPLNHKPWLKSVIRCLTVHPSLTPWQQGYVNFYIGRYSLPW